MVHSVEVGLAHVKRALSRQTGRSIDHDVGTNIPHAALRTRAPTQGLEDDPLQSCIARLDLVGDWTEAASHLRSPHGPPVEET